MIRIVVALVWLYIVAMVVYALMSWFPVEPGTPLAKLNHALATIIEPVVRPVRRVIPPVAGLDLSFMVVMFALIIIVDRI